MPGTVLGARNRDEPDTMPTLKMLGKSREIKYYSVGNAVWAQGKAVETGKE